VYAQLTGTYNKPIQTFADTTGTYFDRHRIAYGLEEVGFTALDMATFEDLPWWAKHFMNGAVTPTSDAHPTALAYDWLFSPAPSTDNQKSSTWEFNEDGNPYESGQVMVTQATLRMNVGNNNEPA
jgi:hypothetical protein